MIIALTLGGSFAVACYAFLRLESPTARKWCQARKRLQRHIGTSRYVSWNRSLTTRKG
jgi:hypothetical protein